MKILLLYPPTPETFWSFKHVLRFVSKRTTFPPLGLESHLCPKCKASLSTDQWKLRKCPTCGALARRLKHDRSLIPAHEGTV